MNVFKPYRFYTKDEIEGKAHDVLKIMEQENFPPQWPFDATRAADALAIMIFWDKIPPDAQGDIVAKILPLERKIVLNQNIAELRGGFEQSTIAHEIGHWVLHINQDEADDIIKQIENLRIEQAERLFLCRQINEKINQSFTKSKINKIEWQAQYFASCLLMPLYKLQEARRGRDLTNWCHLYAIVDELGVTISNLINRLKGLGWIHVSKNNKQIYPGKALPNR